MERPLQLALSSTPEPLPLPEDRCISFGWKAIPISSRKSVRFTLPGGKWLGGEGSFRFALAIDKRHDVTVIVELPESGRELARLHLRVPQCSEITPLPLDEITCHQVAKEGIALRLPEQQERSEIENALWIFCDDQTFSDGREYLQPHLLPLPAKPLSDSELWHNALQRVCSYASIQPFGWMEGCPLEAMLAIQENMPDWSERASEVWQQHLDVFFQGDEMIYSGPRGEPRRNVWGNVEVCLMAASLAMYRPDHPAMDKVIEYWNSYFIPETNKLKLPMRLTCEGCLTIAYPSAVAGFVRQDERLLEQAVQHLQIRAKHLVTPQGIWLRANALENGQTDNRSYLNWSRGLAWYLIGNLRTLAFLPKDFPGVESMREETARTLAWVQTLPREDGLWFCFAHQPETGKETSGSAGIAAALFKGYGLGLCDQKGLAAAQECFDGLTRYLTPDGLLHGVTQGNKREGGIDLQSSGYRVHNQMGSGLAVLAYVWSSAHRKPLELPKTR